MALDRDIAVAVARAYFPDGPPTRAAWELTASTGVRGLRLLVESGRFERTVLSEASDRSFPVLARNCARYAGAVARHDDARRGRAEDRQSFDYVDIDPYGSPMPYLPAALAALRPGGLLAVTATDMMVLAGAQPSATRRLYGAEPVRGRLGPEGALRILLATLVRAGRNAGVELGCAIAYVGDHHVRAYLSVREERGPVAPVALLDPARFAGPDLSSDRPVGPLWTGPLFSPEILPRLERPAGAAAPDRFDTMLSTWREEATVPVPFYYEANRLARSLGLPRPPSRAALIAALGEAGFRASRTHVRPEGIRTDAPRVEVERIARAVAGRG